MTRLRALRAAVRVEARARADYWRASARAADADVAAYASSGQWNTMYCQHARLWASWARFMITLWEVAC